MPEIRILVPTGHMGTMPFETESFELGVATRPDFICADSGSADIGPFPLGQDTPPSAELFQKHDLKHMLLAARKLGVPMIVGSAADTGTDSGVDRYERLIREITKEHGLAPFKLATIYSEIPKSVIAERMAAGEEIEGLSGLAPLDDATLARTDRIVAVMGAEPIRAALRAGADVIIAGRSCDAAIFAAPLLEAGFSKADAYYAGKALECASFCAEPFRGKESVLGRVADDGVYLTPMNPGQRCTPTSVAAHAMYERANPFREYVPGGYVDMSNCKYEQVDEKTTRVTGHIFVESSESKIKLEGAGKIGERRIFIAGVRDPYTIENFDAVLKSAYERVEKIFGPPNQSYRLHYHVYGRNGVMENFEPRKHMPAHELGIIVDVLCDNGHRAEEICHIAGKSLFMTRLPESKGTAGSAAIFSDEVITMQPSYEWTVNHLVLDKEATPFFRTNFAVLGVNANG